MAAARLEFYDILALFGVWVIYLWAMSFGVILEGPMGGIWFWSVTGALALWSASPPGERPGPEEARPSAC